MSHEEIDTMAIGAMTVLGIGFCILSFQADQEIQPNCKSDFLRYGWTIIQNIGLCIATLGISYFICSSYGSCYAEQSSQTLGKRQTIYIALFFVLGLMIFVVSWLIYAGRKDLSDEDKKACGDSSASDKYVMINIIFSGVLVIIPIAMGIFGFIRASLSNE